MGEKVRATIISKIIEAKYYSIILDCTTDVSIIKQMSLVIRVLNKDSEEFDPKEYFIKFLPVELSTGESITDLILQELDKVGLKIENIRG